MRYVARSAVLGCGLLLATALGAQAQTTYYPSPYGQYYPSYNYTYSYPSYGPGYAWPNQTYLGYSYPAPLAFWDPYVWYRPYSDNAGPKASGHGGF